MRVYEIAKAAGVSSKQTREVMAFLGVPPKSASSAVLPILSDALVAHLSQPEPYDPDLDPRWDDWANGEHDGQREFEANAGTCGVCESLTWGAQFCPEHGGDEPVVIKTLVGSGPTSTYRMTDEAGNFLGFSGKP